MAVLHSLGPTPPSLQSAESMQAMHAFFTQCGMLVLRGQSVEARHWTHTPASRSQNGVLVPAQAEACVHEIGSGSPPPGAASPTVRSSRRGSHPAAEVSARAATAASFPRVRIGDLEPRRDRLVIDLGLAYFLPSVSNRRAREQARLADHEQTGNRPLPHTP
jgi:hypothetical protein